MPRVDKLSLLEFAQEEIVRAIRMVAESSNDLDVKKRLYAALSAIKDHVKLAD